MLSASRTIFAIGAVNIKNNFCCWYSQHQKKYLYFMLPASRDISFVCSCCWCCWHAMSLPTAFFFREEYALTCLHLFSFKLTLWLQKLKGNFTIIMIILICNYNNTMGHLLWAGEIKVVFFSLNYLKNRLQVHPCTQFHEQCILYCFYYYSLYSPDFAAWPAIFFSVENIF